MQTIVPFFLSPTRPLDDTRQHHVQLPDDDIVVLHENRRPSLTETDRSVLLVHGLAGAHDSGYMVRLADKLLASGCRVWRMDMRGCGAGTQLARGVFHADRHGDLIEAVKFISQQMPESPITIVGFSLGANLLLKMLGTSADALPAPVDSAMAVSPPIDLACCCENLTRGLARMYDAFFARQLWKEFCQRRSTIRDSSRVVASSRPRTLLRFDEQVTAPLAGFETVADYYRAASSQDDLHRIRIPTVILTAGDDPIVPVAMYDGATFSPSIQLFVTDGGGHLGYLGCTGMKDRDDEYDSRWMDWRLVQWIRSLR